jgi:dTDP-4-dehydrorhamnose 3,5-epimerase
MGIALRARATLGLPNGVEVRPLVLHSDSRGGLVEIFRDNWLSAGSFVQWNIVYSERNALRGVHVHFRHVDYLVVLQGEACVAVSDIRQDSPTLGCSECLELSTDPMRALVIPTGVAHGIFSRTPTVIAYGVSGYYDPQDELGCRWDDADLGIPWEGVSAPVMSERDLALPSLRALIESQ